MKVQQNQLQDTIAKQGFGGAFSCLFYGPDHGVKTDLSNMVAKNFFNVGGAGSVVSVDFSDPSVAFDAIFAEFLNYDLVPTKKVVKVSGATDKLTQAVQTLCDKVGELSADVIMLVIAEELGPKSSLRVLYEGHKSLISVGCYTDSPEDLTTIAATMLKSANIDFEPEVPRFLSSCFFGDRLALKNEILKLSLYLDGDTKLTTPICQYVVDESLSYGSDVFLDNLGGGDPKIAIAELDRAFYEGANSVGMIRVVMGHFLKLKDMLYNITYCSSNIDAEIAANRIFFKRAPAYRRQLTKISFSRAVMIIGKLIRLETKAKQCGEDVSEILVKQALMGL